MKMSAISTARNLSSSDIAAEGETSKIRGQFNYFHHHKETATSYLMKCSLVTPPQFEARREVRGNLAEKTSF